jgi:hypothetical protein
MKKSLLTIIAVYCFAICTFGQLSIDKTETLTENTKHSVFVDEKHSEKDKEKQAPKIDKGEDNILLIESGNNQVVLRTANGCGIGNFLIPTIGDSTQGISPMLGMVSENSSYEVLETVPGTQIKGVAFLRRYWPENTSIISNYGEPYVVVSDKGMFSYSIITINHLNIETIYKLDSIIIPGILKMAKQITTQQNNPIVLLVEDVANNLHIKVYSYPNLQEQFSFNFHFEPEIFEVSNEALFITGRDTNGSYMLYHYSTLQDSLIAMYSLNDSVSNAQEILHIGDSIYFLSSPGDSIVVLSTINVSDSVLTQNTIYHKSGARATYNEYQNHKYFTFQPTSDIPDSVLDKQILVLNPQTIQLDTLQINLQLDQFKHPIPNSSNAGSRGFSMKWIGAKWQNGISDSVFIADAVYNNKIVRLQATAFPHYINATYACWAGVSENELDKIKFDVYPNPASSEVVINLTGLDKGKEYTMNITDISGKLHYTTKLEACQKINLPIHTLSKGLYFVNLNTGKNIITQKLLIQ